MSDEDTIRVVEIVETEYGEKAVIESPYDAKDFIKALPFFEYGEYDNYEAELQDSEVDPAVIEGIIDYGFDEEYASHVSWDPDILENGNGAWVLDVDAWEVASAWFEHAGFETAIDPSVAL